MVPSIIAAIIRRKVRQLDPGARLATVPRSRSWSDTRNFVSAMGTKEKQRDSGPVNVLPKVTEVQNLRLDSAGP